MSSHPQNQSLSPSIPWLIVCIGTGWFLANVPILPGSPIFEFNFYFVIPAGSILVGLVAGIIYGAPHLMIHRRPSGNWVTSSFCGALLAYPSYRYFEFLNNGGSGFEGFWNWIDPAEMQLCWGSCSGETFSAGPIFGWIIFLSTLLGYLIITAGCLAGLAMALYCDKCGKYLDESFTQEKFTLNNESYQDLICSFKGLLDDNKYVDALVFFSDKFGQSDLGENQIMSKLTMHRCPSCSIHHLEIDSSKRSDEKDGNVSWSSPDDNEFEEKFVQWIESNYDVSEFYSRVSTD